MRMFSDLGTPASWRYVVYPVWHFFFYNGDFPRNMNGWSGHTYRLGAFSYRLYFSPNILSQFNLMTLGCT
jgi:hypothetical protein